MSIPKLKDLAAATGVHEMTASRALRNVGRMRPETRQRILDAARQMGYRPNAAAAAMRTGRTGCIAMISGSRLHASQLSPAVLSAIVEAVTSYGGYLVHAVIPVPVGNAKGATLPPLFGRRMAEGVLLDCAPEESAPLEDFLLRNGLPAVWMNHKRRCNAVYPDDFGAAQKVTEQLFALGHRRIAFAQLARGNEMALHAAHDCVADCVAGYEAAMRQAGLTPDVLVFDGHWDKWNEPVASRLQTLAEVFCDPARRPTAVIAYGDGPVLLGLLQQLGVRAPEDVSLVSFSGDAAQAVEQLPSWAPIPGEAMGSKAVEMLFQLIESGQKEGPAISLPYGEIASLHTVRKIG
jgi:LacI family transcriptional regulator